MTLGDSYTWGVGATHPAMDGWPTVAARRWELLWGTPVVLENLARPGMNSTTVRQLIEDRLDGGPPPDAVAVLMGINNPRWLGQSGQFCLDEQVPESATPVRWLKDWRIYRVLRHLTLSARPPRPEDTHCVRLGEAFRLLDQGLPDAAERIFTEVATGSPRSAWARLGLALAQIRQGRHPLAVDALESAAELGLSSPALPLTRAMELRNVGRTVEAEAALLGVEGDLVELRRYVEAWLLRDRGQLEAARLAFVDLVAHCGNPDGPPVGSLLPWAEDGLGWTLLAQGRQADAEQAFKASLEHGAPLSLTPHLLGWPALGLARLAVARHDQDAADSWFATAERDPSATAASWALRGWATGICVEATPWFLRASSAVPGQEEAGIGIAACESTGQLPALDGPGGPPVTARPSLAPQLWVDPTDARLLWADLERVAEATRRRRLPLLLLTYPQPDAHDELNAAILAFAAARHLQVVDVREQMRTALVTGTAWDQLFVPDGHPTSLGYRVIGEAVAEALPPPSGSAAPSPSNEVR